MQKDSCRRDKAGGGQHFVPRSREALYLLPWLEAPRVPLGSVPVTICKRRPSLCPRHSLGPASVVPAASESHRLGSLSMQ